MLPTILYQEYLLPLSHCLLALELNLELIKLPSINTAPLQETISSFCPQLANEKLSGYTHLSDHYLLKVLTEAYRNTPSCSDGKPRDAIHPGLRRLHRLCAEPQRSDDGPAHRSRTRAR